MSDVLVLIDLQRVFADSGSPWAAPDFPSIVPVIGDLVEAHAPRVVFTRFIAPERPAGAWIPYYEQFPFALQPPDAPLWELVVDPADHPVVDAPTFGKWGPALRSAIDGLGGADRIVLAGVSTDCCVLSTALAAVDDGMAVEVVATACAGATAADHQRALDAMALYAPLITIRT